MNTRYAELTRSLLQAIEKGVHPVGSTLPGEIELAAMHGVSRGTVRAALGQLQDLGVVSRKKRAGTRVEAQRPTSEFSSELSTVEGLVQYSTTTRRRVHGTREVVIDLALEKRLGCKAGERWLHLGTTRSEVGQPDRALSWSDNYVTMTDGRQIRRHVADSQELISDMIARATGRVVKEIRQEIRAVPLTPEIAATLGAEPGSPALQLRRQYFDQTNNLFEVVVSTHPCERFVYSTTLRRS